MRGKRNLHKGDEIIICKKRYRLIKRFGGVRGGGWQFRTWLVEDLDRRKRRREYVIKVTTKPRRMTSELKFYIYLDKNGFPSRYFPELIAYDNEAIAYRDDKRIGKFHAILLKRYDGSFESFLHELNPDEKRRIMKKLEEGVEILHELGIVHGDLRESNVLLKRSKRGIGVLLTDFSNSKFLCNLSNSEKKKLIEKDWKRLDKMIERILNSS